MQKRAVTKSPVRENRTPGSVRGTLGNQRTYLDEENKEYDQQGLICGWEHCVEHFPLEKEAAALSCPVFGHDCPGGMNVRAICERSIDEIPKKRFI